MLSARGTFAALAAAVLSIATAAQASPLQDYNLIVFGDLTSSTNVQGNTLVGGDIYGPAADFAVGLAGIDPSTVTLQVGGSIHATNLNLNNGSAEVGGSIFGNLNNNGGGNISTGVALDISSIQSQLQNDSIYLASLTPNSSVSLPGVQPSNITFNAVAGVDDYAVFSVVGDDVLSNNLAQSILLIDDNTEAIIINVSGTNVTFDQGNMGSVFNNLSVAEKIVWNFYEAQTVTINREMFGSVLAPFADVEVVGAGNGISGSVAVNSLNLQSQVHLPTFTPDVPEPTSLMLLSAGSLLLARRVRQS